MGTTIDIGFPGGSIQVVRLGPRGPIELALEEDSASTVRQWFAFRVEAPLRRRELLVVNASDASFPGGWPGYRAMASTDGRTWYRAPTEYAGGALSIRHEPRGPSTLYAYFATYAPGRVDRLLAHLARTSSAEIAVVGATAMGRALPVVRLGTGPLVVWILGRQHAGESPASFVLDGLLRRLARAAGDHDVGARDLLERATLFVAPLVDLDGAALGNMRTSATGANLNRCWDDPDPRAAPEVAALLEAMQRTGVDLFLDVHADESSPYAFAAGSEGNPGVTDHALGREGFFTALLAEETTEFVDEPFYPLDRPGEADLSCASNQIGFLFGCPALTLELPIKDVGDERVPPGWSVPRARRFGAGLVEALARYVHEVA